MNTLDKWYEMEEDKKRENQQKKDQQQSKKTTVIKVSATIVIEVKNKKEK